MWGLGMLVAATLVPAVQGQTDWPNFSHDEGGTRYSPLKQINTKNVSQLKLAWTFDPTAPVVDTPRTGGGFGGQGPSAPEAVTPNAPAAACGRSRCFGSGGRRAPDRRRPLLLGPGCANPRVCL